MIFTIEYQLVPIEPLTPPTCEAIDGIYADLRGAMDAAKRHADSHYGTCVAVLIKQAKDNQSDLVAALVKLDNKWLEMTAPVPN